MDRAPAYELSGADRELVDALRARDEAAFAKLVDELSPGLLRVAREYVRDDQVAREAVQETWLGVIKGIDRFEGRSSLKTWIFRILMNIARTRGKKEARSAPFSSLAAGPEDEPALDPDRFKPADADRAPNHWAVKPQVWLTPEEQLLAGETRQVILDAIDRLPPQQRTVITLRDIEGWDAEETRNALEISETNQRVLLHRARSKVRAALEEYDNGLERDET
jgi:RNA polymerase sigma-70 factor (ECF subfamily)